MNEEPMESPRRAVGVQVAVDYSWIAIFLLVPWSLSGLALVDFKTRLGALSQGGRAG